MKIFADTANLEELRELATWGIIDGVTTNPLIVAKEKDCNFKQRILEIRQIVKGPLSVEVIAEDAEGIIREAREYNAWCDDIAIKIPITPEGLKAVTVLSKEGIKTNVTVCMNARQCILAAKAGATYASLFWGRIEDMGYDAEQVTNELRAMLDLHGYDTEIILGSIRTNTDLNKSMASGAHILTVPGPLLLKSVYHPRTESTIKEFLDGWAKFEGK